MQTQAALQPEPRTASPTSAQRCRVISIDELARTRRRREEPEADAPALTLRCVHSDYLGDGCSCQASVPAEVAVNAWRQDRLERLLQDGLFRFHWRGEVWLGYGLPDGAVRGVYCPEHNARRSERYHRQSELPEPSDGTQLRAVSNA
jgi:hypothetical protein